MQKLLLKDLKKWLNSIPDEMLENTIILCDEDGKCYPVEDYSVDPFEKGKQTYDRPVIYFNRRIGR